MSEILANFPVIKLTMKEEKLFTIVFVQKEDQTLLGLKKRGFGKNKWNGFGGKVEADETILDAAVRELEEECCLSVKPEHLNYLAHLVFTSEGQPTLTDIRVFSINIFEGTPKETEEMKPKWFKNDDVPFDDMWPDFKLWFPYMQQGKQIYGSFHYDGSENLLYYKIEEQESIEALCK